MNQYPLAIDFPISYEVQDYYVSDANRAAFDMVMGSEYRIIFLQGGRCHGKTHLAHIFCYQHQGRLLSEAELLQGYENLDFGNIEFGGGYFAVDNIEFLPLAGQLTLFHLHNKIVADNYGGLLVTSKLSPKDIATHDKMISGTEEAGLQDWHSRLSGFMFCEAIEGHADDRLLLEILNKNLRERQIYLTSHQLNYIISRASRDLYDLQKIVKRLHEALLASPKVKITKTFIKQFL